MDRNKLVAHLNQFLNIENFQDSAPNGLQVEGKSKITRIITGVSACLELFEYAVACKADAVIVHHGLIWNSTNPIYKGSYREKIKILLENKINLLAYHLPLDAHLKIGNNLKIAQALSLKNIEPFGLYNGVYIGVKGTSTEPLNHKFFKLIKDKINRQAQILPFGKKHIKTVGIISGGAQKEIFQALAQNLDVFITGESTEFIYHLAKEEKIHFVSAGHHATETFGVNALTDHLNNQFEVSCEFKNINNPF